MDAPVLILRPREAANRTAERALALGLNPIHHPLFALVPLDWSLPDTPATALLLTSANAVRLAGPLPGALTRLPVFAVGETTAQAGRASGLTVEWVGDSDGAAAVRALAVAGHTVAWHLRGRDARVLPPSPVSLAPLITYAAEPIDAPLPALPPGTVALLHSPRAAERFAELMPAESRAGLVLVAISAATADAAGGGWRRVEVAKRPADDAMLTLAAKLVRPDGDPRRP